jgi:bifunctional UDP-N-acetylglucosamine pyrophosphorylase/glucosamine-1-phosphate N-acetyltransferase/UDP-N-acetylglucosamine pyrophosphorylase
LLEPSKFHKQPLFLEDRMTQELNPDAPLAIVLAAGQGTRMKSDLPKVLCQVRGRPMIDYVLDALAAGGVEQAVVVVGYRSDDVRNHLKTWNNLDFVEQTERLGTGHAVKMAQAALEMHRGPVVIVAGDSPMIQAASVRRLLAEFKASQPACLLGTLHKENPFGLGRIVRDAQGNFAGIVEEKDATEEQRRLTEVNMSTYVFSAPELVHALNLLRNDNRQKEFYLTDCPGILQAEGKLVQALSVLQPCEALSINTVDELSVVEEKMKEMGYN